MRTLFTWFYCLPITDAVSLVILASTVFLLLRKFFGNTSCWKAGVSLLFICWSAVILLGTLVNRTAGENLSGPILTPFYSYYTALRCGQTELYRENFMNAVLFYPVGLLGCEILPKRWRPITRILLTGCILLLASIAIECLQYFFSLGLAETDDVIHNALGALLGALVWRTPSNLSKFLPKRR